MPISETSPTNHEFAALVGLDWADQKHDVCLLDLESQRQELSVIAHRPESIDEWAIQLRERFGGRPVAVCLEQSRGSLVYALMKYEYLILFPLNPVRLRNFRQAVCSSGAKDDPTDASLLLQYLTQHRQHLTAWRPDDTHTRQLSFLVEQRRQAIGLRTQLSNRLQSALKQYCPQMLQWAGDEVYGKLSCDLVIKWPTLSAIQKASPAALRKFFYGHNSRSEERMLQRLEQIRSAKPLVTDQAIIESYSLTAVLLAKQLLELGRSIDAFDKALAKLLAQHPDAPIFTSFPGAGEVMAPRLLAAFGSDRSRFTSPAAMQNLCGVAPVTKRSGRTCVVHRRYACPKFLRQTFHEYAGHSLLKSTWAKAFYRMQRDRGQSHHTALRALAYKWIRILFRCWQQRTPYNEATYLAALQRHNAPLLKYLGQTPASCG